MNRRTFVKSAGVAAAAAALPAAAMAAPDTQRRVEWTMPTSWPESLAIQLAAHYFADAVSEMTRGRFTIDVKPAGEATGPLDIFDDVSAGTFKIGHSASYFYTAKSNVLTFASGLPYGLTARQNNAWLMTAGGLELLKPLYDTFNLMTLPCGNTGVQMGGWFNRQINTVDDFDGLKMRVPGIGAQVLSRLGVETVGLPAGEILAAFQAGDIDAAEFVGPHDDQALGLEAVASFYYYSGFWEPGTTTDLLINLDAWNDLPEAYQAAVRYAAEAANQRLLAEYDFLNPTALANIRDSGVAVLPFPRDVMREGRDVARQLISEFADADPMFKQVHDHWDQYRTAVQGWHDLAENTFARFA